MLIYKSYPENGVMSEKAEIKNKHLFGMIKSISNSNRFKIIELTEDKELNITELSSKLNLAYNKCADYVTILEKYGIINKRKDGKEIKVRSKVKLSKNKIEFS